MAKVNESPKSDGAMPKLRLDKEAVRVLGVRTSVRAGNFRADTSCPGTAYACTHQSGT